MTREMVAAGEAVLDRAFVGNERSQSWSVLSAARNVYIAMERARVRKEALDQQFTRQSVASNAGSSDE